MIKRNFTDRSEETIVSLYKSLVRPHLEFCTPVYSPHLVKDSKLIEGVQCRAIKLVQALSTESTKTDLLIYGYLDWIWEELDVIWLIHLRLWIVYMMYTVNYSFFIRWRREKRTWKEVVQKRFRLDVKKYVLGGKVICVPVALPASTLVNMPAEGNQRFHLQTKLFPHTRRRRILDYSSFLSG